MSTFWKPSNGGELYHYGVVGMRWGVHKVRKYSKAGDVESKTQAQQTIVTKSTKKLNRYNRRYERNQNTADRRFARAERRTRRLFFKNPKGAARSMRWGARAQYRADKAAYKGKKWYQHMEKAFKDAQIPVDPETRRIGEKLVMATRANSRSSYGRTY